MQAAFRLVLCWLCLATVLSPEVVGLDTPEQLVVYAGYTVYNNPEYDSVSLVEFPFSIRRHQLKFVPLEGEDSTCMARVFAQVDLIDAQGRQTDSAGTYFSVRAAGPGEAAREGIRVFNNLSLFAGPGIYSVRLTVIDAISKSEGERFLGRVVVPPPARRAVAISGVRLAYDVDYVGDPPEGANRRLIRNGYRIIPNPLSVYGTDDSVVFLYGEVYNLTFSEDDPSTYQLSLAVTAADSTTYRDFGSRVAEKPGSSLAVAESFEIKGWPSGLYFVRLAVTDLEAAAADTSYTPFRILSPSDVLAAVEQSRTSDPYDTLSLEIKERLVVYQLTPVQKATLSDLTDQGKENFLEQYWREHDEYPSTPEIENRRELVERFEHANRVYSTNLDRDNGWISDRGRIWMIYGPYDQINDVPAPRLVNPYQVWYYYEIKEGKFFIFEDRRGYHDYLLVHSNIYGEIYSWEWQQKIQEGYIEIGGY